jgi:predicted CXXCH cytochrome family protein
MINEALSKNKLHWPVFSKGGCSQCHSPHGSPQGRLLKEKTIVLCGQCHPDTIARQIGSKTKHKPIQDGSCEACHSPHASDTIYLLKQPTVVELCGSCHDWQKHSTHPIGDKYVDGRNKNLRVDCLSCHRSHGTEFKNMNYFPTDTEACTQCHATLRR